MRVLVLLSVALSLAAADSEFVVDTDRPIPELLVDAEFESELDLAISATWDNVGLRDIARRISDNRQISILLDRRLDPSREVPFEVNNETVLDVLQQIAAKVSARCSVVSSTVYLGPPESAARLRTLIALRTGELFDKSLMVPPGRRFELDARQTLHWNDLDRPADLIRTIAKAYELEVEGLEEVAHDLWAGATLPAVSAVEALSMILIQFDLTFGWTEGAAGIRIVPVPEEVYLERTYSTRGMPPAKAAEKLAARVPDLQIEPQRDKLLVRGTLEQQEAVDRLLNPKRRTAATDEPDGPVPLSQQEFTLRVQAVRARALFRKLEESGVELEYDADELDAAGVNLDQRIDMDVTKVTADEFFQAICEPLRLKFTIDGAAVTLEPK